ncbi:hypothetical protein [Aquiflexum sp.]|uniref:hypothetical protein n=1 Tax=Aquiflexum sp. TaxID=1872584 RepID=UPI0035933EBD
MKKNVLLPILLMLIIASPLSAKVIRVNNQETVSKPEENSYITMIEAYNAAGHADTIYLEPTAVAHGNLEVGKRIVFIGGGYFHDQNPDLNAQPFSSLVTGTWTFKLGSLGSKLIGLSFSRPGGSIFLEVNDIEISNCYFSGASSSIGAGRRINAQNNLENLTVSGCFFSSTNSSSWNNVFNNVSLINIVFINNISLRPVNIANNSTGVFSNNLIQSTTFSIGENSNFQVHNNIFLDMTSITIPNAIGSNLSHNVANHALFGTANNNQANVPIGDLFIVSESTDGKYQIKEGGPADGQGRDGVDIGPFGGAKPYKLSGLPDIPVVYQLTTTGVSNSAGKLPITIKVKAN